MSKKEKNNELELILEKLKESYGNNADSDDEPLSDSSVNENDEELNSMLTKIFSQPIQNDSDKEKIVEAPTEQSKTTSEKDLPSSVTQKSTKSKIRLSPSSSDADIEFSIKSGKKKAKALSSSENAEKQAYVGIAHEEEQDSPIFDSLDDDIFDPTRTRFKLAQNSPDDSQGPSLPDTTPTTVSHSKTDSDSQLETPRPSREENEQVDNVLRLMFANKGRNTLEAKTPEEAINTDATQKKEELLETAHDDTEVCSEYIKPITIQHVEEQSVIKESSLETGALGETEQRFSLDDTVSEVNAEAADIGEIADNTVSEEPVFLHVDDPLQGHLSDGNPDNKNIFICKADIAKSTSVQNPREEISSDDISLLLKLGYDEEIKSEAAKECTESIKQEIARSFMPEKDNTPFGFCGKEFFEREQIPEIKKQYSKDKKKLIIRIAGVSVIALILLFLNLTYNFTPQKPIYTAFPLFETVLILIACGFSFYGLRSGFKAILHLEPNVYSASAFAVTVFYIYNIATIVLSLFSDDSPKIVMLGAVTALYLLFPLLSRLADCCRESASFNTIASAESLYAAERFNEDLDELSKKSRRSGTFTENSKNTHEKIFRIKKSSLVSGYFSRTSAKSGEYTGLLLFFAIIPLIALLIGCVSLILKNTVIEAMTAMAFTVFMGIPLTAVLYISIPHFNASKALSKHGCVIIGNASVSEYAQTHSLIFEDTEAITVHKGIEIRPENQANIKKSANIIAKVFAALGGPLSEILGNSDALDSEDAPTDISIVSVKETGIELYMDSSVHVLIGDKNFLAEHKIKVSNDSAVNSSVNSKTNSILYVALDGVPELGYIVENRIKKEFIKTASLLDRHNIKTIVKTYSPEINNYYFEHSKTSDMPIITVYKPSEYEYPSQSTVTDSGLIATNDCKKTALAIINCRNILHRRKKHKIYSTILSIFGILISAGVFVFSSIFGNFEWLLEYRAEIILIFQLIGIIPIFTKSNGKLPKD